MKRTCFRFETLEELQSTFIGSVLGSQKKLRYALVRKNCIEKPLLWVMFDESEARRQVEPLAWLEHW